MSLNDDPTSILVRYTRGLLDRLEEFFRMATGTHAIGFSTIDGFDEMVRSQARNIAPRVGAAFTWLDSEVRKFQETEGTTAFQAAKLLGGMRLVLGGSSRFQATQLNGVRNSLLYADTVLIPDPVLPWLERQRNEERFKHVLVLKAVHCLLQLKLLVDADLPYPALVIFPSWEKSLEDSDQVTISGIRQLVTDTVAWATGEQLSTAEEVVEYAGTRSDEFLAAAERHVFVVAPGGVIGQSLSEALQATVDDYKNWRADDWLETYISRSAPMKVLSALEERLAPIYHLIENAMEFGGHPLMCIEQQAHYFRMVSSMSDSRLERLHYLRPETSAIVRAFGSRRLEWLSSVDMKSLIKLRQNNGNEEFRRLLSTAVGRVHEADLGSVDRVAAEFCHELDVAIAKHNRDFQEIQNKYNNAHGQTALLCGGAFVAMLMPALTPLLGAAAPFALSAKYAKEKRDELREKKQLTQSLVGILASKRPTN